MGSGTDWAASTGESQRYAQLAGTGATTTPAQCRSQCPGQRCPGTALCRRPSTRSAPATGNFLARSETLGRNRHRTGTTANRTRKRNIAGAQNRLDTQSVSAQAATESLRYPALIDRAALRWWWVACPQRAKCRYIRAVAARLWHLRWSDSASAGCQGAG